MLYIERDSAAYVASSTPTGQKREWKAHHRKICQSYVRPSPTSALRALSATDDLDALLASQVVAEMFPKDSYMYEERNDGSPFSTFMSLLRHPQAKVTTTSSYPSREGVIYGSPLSMADEVRSRFPNNNFMIHSHLTSYAIGIFPLASRLFNHSCVPNAVVKFVITPGERVRMDVIALTTIDYDDEVCIRRCFLQHMLLVN